MGVWYNHVLPNTYIHVHVYAIWGAAVDHGAPGKNGERWQLELLINTCAQAHILTVRSDGSKETALHSCVGLFVVVAACMCVIG